VTDGGAFRLKDIDPGDTLGLGDEAKAAGAGKRSRWACDVLAGTPGQALRARPLGRCCLIFQAMDPPAGKDGAIKHVMSGVNPQRCQVFSFKGAEQRGPRPRTTCGAA